MSGLTSILNFLGENKYFNGASGMISGGMGLSSNIMGLRLTDDDEKNRTKAYNDAAKVGITSGATDLASSTIGFGTSLSDALTKNGWDKNKGILGTIGNIGGMLSGSASITENAFKLQGKTDQANTAGIVANAGGILSGAMGVATSGGDFLNAVRKDGKKDWGEIFSSGLGALSGAAGAAGGTAGIAGNSKVSGILGAVSSGLGILGSLAQMFKKDDNTSQTQQNPQNSANNP